MESEKEEEEDWEKYCRLVCVCVFFRSPFVFLFIIFILHGTGKFRWSWGETWRATLQTLNSRRWIIYEQRDDACHLSSSLEIFSMKQVPPKEVIVKCSEFLTKEWVKNRNNTRWSEVILKQTNSANRVWRVANWIIDTQCDVKLWTIALLSPSCLTACKLTSISSAYYTSLYLRDPYIINLTVSCRNAFQEYPTQSHRHWPLFY